MATRTVARMGKAVEKSDGYNPLIREKHSPIDQYVRLTPTRKTAVAQINCSEVCPQEVKSEKPKPVIAKPKKSHDQIKPVNTKVVCSEICPQKVIPPSVTKTESNKHTNSDMYPYNKYNSYGMEWAAIVDELEWSNSHRTGKTTKQRTPFDADEGSLGMTSPEKTRVKFYDKKAIQKGSFIHLVVETFDENGRKRDKGGDYFSSVMSNINMQKSTAGRTVDYGNGTYSVYLYAAWTGKADITIALTHTREAINYLKDVQLVHDLLRTHMTYNDSTKSETIECGLITEGVWTNKCEYSNPNAMGDTKIICDKPKGLQCDQVHHMHGSGKMLDDIIKKQSEGYQYLFSRRYTNGIIHGMPLSIKILDGYWDDNNTFVPLVCRSKQWSVEEADKCLSDTEFVVSGDSTIWQFGNIMNRHFHKKFVNIMVVPRFGGPPSYFWDLILESDLMDTITIEKCRAKTPVVVLNFSFHYGVWSTRSYLQRIYRAKLAIDRLIERCPKSKVVIKLAHARDNVYLEQSIHSSNWIFYNMNRMVRRVFWGSGVIFLDVWDMALSAPYTNTVHMASQVLFQELHLMFSYICPHLVS
uniref:NXPE family member 3-like n=1 Tax=Saccoglossus kowalevskii TaxID=10224 RepID=A0ABM0MN54_SACKO|nr:PREDICTED: NXPE family member 3-like [Saccoglossus kowalevskii]